MAIRSEASVKCFWHPPASGGEASTSTAGQLPVNCTGLPRAIEPWVRSPVSSMGAAELGQRPERAPDSALSGRHCSDLHYIDGGRAAQRRRAPMCLGDAAVLLCMGDAAVICSGFAVVCMGAMYGGVGASVPSNAAVLSVLPCSGIECLTITFTIHS